uniref:Probable ATP-dependent transporter ycf16 n=1 Tax=Erythrolobus australicus TaxID=1077150 RepID=A0A7S1TLB7_9RHOD|mmetsp:Transcript_3475/g.9504  ORF Transcript_3475/g.9504 Transcript_3475/m.9504 type:complete len:929 (+) Transcript_3475:163-2949(+)
MGRYWRVVGALTKKNVLLLVRDYGGLAVILIAPLIVSLLLFVTEVNNDANGGFAPDANELRNPVKYPINKIPLCSSLLEDSCFTLAYAPLQPHELADGRVLDAGVWVQKVAARNNVPDEQVIGLADSAALNAFLVARPNVTQAAYVFEPRDFELLGSGNVSFVVQYNNTPYEDFPLGQSFASELAIVPAMLASMSAVLIENLTGAGIEVTLMSSEYPHPELAFASNAVADYGPFLYYGTYTMALVLLLTTVTAEKELKLRLHMRMVGQLQSQHILSWLAVWLPLMTLTGLLLIAWGAAFQLGVFLPPNTFTLSLITFVLFGISLVLWLFLLATLTRRVQTVNEVVFTFYLLNYLVGQAGQFTYQVTPDGQPLLDDSLSVLRYIFALFPGAMFFRCVGLLAFAAPFGGLNWDNYNTQRYFPMDTCWAWMIWPAVVAFVLAIYLENVLPDQFGARRQPWYFLQPSYWRRHKRKPDSNQPVLQNEAANAADAAESVAQSAQSASDAVEVNRPVGPPQHSASAAAIPADLGNENYLTEHFAAHEDAEDDDVIEERRLIDTRDPELEAQSSIIIRNMVKRFKRDFFAVNGVSLSVRRDSLFALLGHNGAGKSTLFNLLTGVIPVTEGDAFIYGLSVVHDQDAIREIMGVCPQHDVLWASLTPREHIELFAALRGMTRDEGRREAEERLAQVNLTHKADARASSLSGGMQRRLSVAISLTGSPRIVFLDEATTGMDPVSRREVWEMINGAKRGRVIVLVTHSMEEADVLGDRVGIMARGKLRVVGTPLRLKNKFGAGYKLVVLSAPQGAQLIPPAVKSVIPGAELAQESVTAAGDRVLELSLPKSCVGRAPSAEALEELPIALRGAATELEALVRLLELDEQRDRLGVHNFSVSETTLEEVFLRITSLSAELDDTPGTKQCCSCCAPCGCCSKS